VSSNEEEERGGGRKPPSEEGEEESLSERRGEEDESLTGPPREETASLELSVWSGSSSGCGRSALGAKKGKVEGCSGGRFGDTGEVGVEWDTPPLKLLERSEAEGVAKACSLWRFKSRARLEPAAS
jgi:hypothetical protein